SDVCSSDLVRYRDVDRVWSWSLSLPHQRESPGDCSAALRQTELGELSKEPAGQDISGRSSFGQVLRRVGLFQITPALVSALGPRVDEDQPVLEHDPPAPVGPLLEPKDRAAADQRVLVYPIQRAADHFGMPFRQIARGKALLGLPASEPFRDFVQAL